MSTRIILVRHGQSTYNAEKRFQGRCDESVLTETGRLTAYQTGLSLCSLAFDAVYVSPLKRTQETVREIGAAIATVAHSAVSPQTHPNLQEVHLPQWQGLSYQEVRSRFADAYRQWQEAPHQFQMALPQREVGDGQGHGAIAAFPPASATFSPLHQLYAQAEQVWQEILPKHPGQTVLIVSHGGTIRALISTAIGLNISDYHTLQQSNCGISILNFEQPQQPAQLQALNLTNHLGEVLPKLKNGKQGTQLILLPISHETSDITPLVTRLRSIPLDVCVTDCGDRIQTAASEILSQLPGPILQLQVNQPTFLSDWHQTLHPKMQSQTGFKTVLAIANLDAIRSFLHHILNLPYPSATLYLKPGTLTVLFYPASTHHPVVQVMNLGDVMEQKRK